MGILRRFWQWKKQELGGKVLFWVWSVVILYTLSLSFCLSLFLPVFRNCGKLWSSLISCMGFVFSHPSLLCCKWFFHAHITTSTWSPAGLDCTLFISMSMNGKSHQNSTLNARPAHQFWLNLKPSFTYLQDSLRMNALLSVRCVCALTCNHTRLGCEMSTDTATVVIWFYSLLRLF